MNDSCPVLTPAERQYVDIQTRAERAMLVKVFQAIDDAAAEAAAELVGAGSDMGPPPRDYFAAVAHQKLFVLLCGGDPETYAGGDPRLAARILDNGRNIANHYWGAQKQDVKGWPLFSRRLRAR